MSTLLAYRTLFLGDLLAAVPALRAVRDGFPRHELLLAVTPPLARLAERACPGFTAVPTVELGRPAVTRPDVAVNLHGRGPESHRVIEATRPRWLVAFACTEAGIDGPLWRDDEHEVARWCRLLECYGFATDPDDLHVDVAPAPGVPEGATVVHPGASAAARRWPVDRWARIARLEADAGHPVIVTGAPGERALAAAVADSAGLPASSVWAGRTPDAVDLAAVVAGARMVISGDTGIAHLATAMGTPSVAVFGPVSPRRWGPPPARPWHRALWAGIESDPHAAVPAPGLLAITVDDVVRALDKARSCSSTKELQ